MLSLPTTIPWQYHPFMTPHLGTYGAAPTQWRLVRYTPPQASWHPANDYLRWAH